MLKAGVTVLGLCLSAPLLGQPCVQEREVRPLEVILDLRNGLALVPEGTVIPKDYRISVAAYMLPETTDRSPRAAEERARQALSSGRSTPLKPLVFAYANQSAFDPHRERSKAFAERVRTLSGYCDGPEITYGVPDDPNCEGCTFTLLTTYCIADGPNPELYELTAIAEIASSGSPGYAAASVTSSDAYLNCYSGSPYSSLHVERHSDDLGYCQLGHRRICRVLPGQHHICSSSECLLQADG